MPAITYVQKTGGYLAVEDKLQDNTPAHGTRENVAFRARTSLPLACDHRIVPTCIQLGRHAGACQLNSHALDVADPKWRLNATWFVVTA